MVTTESLTGDVLDDSQGGDGEFDAPVPHTDGERFVYDPDDDSESELGEAPRVTGETPVGGKRQLRSIEEALSAGEIGSSEARDLSTMRAQLAKLPTRRVIIPQNGMGLRQLPDVVITLNGYSTRIKRGAEVEVNQAVYEALLQAGLVQPQRKEDEKHVPRLDPKVKEALAKAGQI